MARLDLENERVIVRIVYDGPAFAGKTTSVKTLATNFSRPVFSSEDASGRTLHFDWMQYEGGRFEQFAVCCQVVTVPGQPDLSARRRRLLEEADAVVFVLDSSRGRVAASLQALESLRELLLGLPHPRPGLILQANWRDTPDAEPIEAIRAQLGVGATVAVTESVATDGTGIRQTFVFAVRLALDRVSELTRMGALARGTPEIASGEALLAALGELESRTAADASSVGTVRPPPLSKGVAFTAMAVPSSPAGAKVLRLGSSVPEIEDEPPWPPSPTVPTGRVWPPVEGRLILHEAAASEVRLERLQSGAWLGMSGPWRLHTAAESVYSDEETARRALVDWARWHASLGSRLSPRRCLALMEEDSGRWRLWQVLRREVNLADALEAALAGGTGGVRTVMGLVKALREAHERLSSSGLLLSLDTVGIFASAVAYVAPVPTLRTVGRLEKQRAGSELKVARLFAPALRRVRASGQGVAADLLELLEDLAGGAADR